MSALNYKAQFSEDVENGVKRQTIRALRKRPIRVGERLHHFTGMRTKQCRRLRAEQEDICLRAADVVMKITRRKGFDIWIDGVLMPDGGLTPFAAQDGFLCAGDFIAFFIRNHGLAIGHPFRGQLITW